MAAGGSTYLSTISEIHPFTTGGRIGARKTYVPSTATSGHSSVTNEHIDIRLRAKYDQQYGGKRLRIQGVELMNLPQELFTISDLEVLILSPTREACIYYHLTEFPRDIHKLTNLRVLVLDTNELTAVPRSIVRLRHLENLALSNNRLKELPDCFWRLEKLTSLHLAHNKFVKFPRVLCQLVNLEFLDFTGNKLQDVDEDIGNLVRLNRMLLAFNRISELPDSLCNLTNLTSLWLGYNRIRFLPNNFGNLVNLDWDTKNYISTMIEGNPLLDPPMEVCKEGIVSIREYFERISVTRSQLRSRSDGNLSTGADSGLGESLPLEDLHGATSTEQQLDDLARRRHLSISSGAGTPRTPSRSPGAGLAVPVNPARGGSQSRSPRRTSRIPLPAATGHPRRSPTSSTSTGTSTTTADLKRSPLVPEVKVTSTTEAIVPTDLGQRQGRPAARRGRARRTAGVTAVRTANIGLTL